MGYKKNVLLELFEYLKPKRKQIVFTMVLLVLSSVFTFIGPILTQMLMDNGFILKDYLLVIKLAIIIFIIEIANSILFIIKEYMRVNLKLELNIQFFKDAFNVIESMEMKMLDGTNNTQLFQDIQNDISNMTLIVDASFLMIISQILNILAGIVGLLTISWRLTLIVLLYIPFKMITVRYFSKEKKNYYAQYMRKSSIFAKWFGDTINGIKDIKLFDIIRKKSEEFEVYQDGIKDTNKKLVLLDSYNNIVDKIGKQAILTVIYIISAINKNQNITIGSVFAFITYASFVISPLTSLLNLKILMSNIILSSKRYFEFIHQSKESTEGEMLEDVFSNESVIEYCNVSFGYEKSILNNFSLKIYKGEKILVVGDNGSGKTTLIKLLIKFYEPISGRILIDGKNVSDISIKSLRSKIAVVWSNSYIFNDSIRNNICLYKDIKKEVLDNALYKCNLYDFYYDKGEGFIIESNGSNISSGQRQKILLARALVKKEVEIIILDEATANLDKDSVEQFKKIINNELGNYTVVIISHNNDMLDAASRVVKVGGLS